MTTLWNRKKFLNVPTYVIEYEIQEILTSTVWIVIQFCTDIDESQRMDPNDFGRSLDFSCGVTQWLPFE